MNDKITYRLSLDVFKNVYKCILNYITNKCVFIVVHLYN